MRKPTELEKAEIDYYFEQELDSHLIAIGQGSASAKGTQYSPKTAKVQGLKVLESLRDTLRKKICIEWGYCKKKHLKAYQNRYSLVLAIGDLIISIAGYISPLQLAVVLVKMGLDTLCECPKPPKRRQK